MILADTEDIQAKDNIKKYTQTKGYHKNMGFFIVVVKERHVKNITTFLVVIALANCFTCPCTYLIFNILLKKDIIYIFFLMVF